MGSGCFGGWGRDVPQTQHATDRAASRYGLQPNETDWRNALLAITGAVLHEPSAAYLMARNQDGTERWIVQLGAAAVIALYDPERALVITLLPKGARNQRT